MNARNKRLKRITVGLLMALVMVVSMLPMSSFTAFAADATVTDTAADTTYPYAVVDTAAGTVTIDGALGGKTTAEESDITALVDAIKGYVDSEITTIIVTGSKSPIIDMGNYTTTAIGEAIYRLSGSGTYDADNQYNGKIDLILSDVTEIIEYEFQNAYALNSITLPNVTKLGYRAFENCQYLKEITFGSVVEEGSPAGDDFKDVGTAVGGCDLVLNHGQQDAETEYQANLADMLWWASTKWKSIFLNHFGGEATCAAQAVCVVCNNSYGELADHSFDVTTGFCNVCGGYQPAVDSNSDGYYEISNAGQLFWFANLVNNYDDEAQNPAANAILTENITVNQNLLSSLTYDENGAVTNGDSFRAWTPIGSVTNIYTGTFDGNNKTVSGLYFNDSATSYVGLFGWVGSGGTVKNVGVIDSYLSGYQGVGGVVGVNHGTVQSCYNSGTVSGSNYVGGVVGNNAGTVTNCYNTGTVSGSSYVGGVVGVNYGTVQSCYNTGTVSGSSDVGGVVGVNHGTVQSCYNTGAVTGGDYSSVGGVVGGNVGTVQNCYYNTETYTGNAIGKNDGTVDALTGGKTAAQFASGEVAYLLQAGQTAGEDGVIPEVWGQNIKTSDTDTEYDAYPTLGGAKVYYGYNSCTETATKIYTNDSTVSAEKPAHKMDATTGKCVCGLDMAKASLTNGETVTYYATLEEAVTAAQSASGSMVQLLDSVTLSNTIKITTGQFTIDLNGKTVTSASDYDAFFINRYDPTVEGANVTIISTVSGGKIESSNGYRSVYVSGDSTAKVIGVELNTAMAEGTLTLENVKITASSMEGIVADNTGNVTILGNSSISGAEYDVCCGTSATITLGEGVTFPDGLTAYSASGYKALNTMLANGMAYWQGDNKMLRLTSDTYEIAGTVTVKAVCTHEGVTPTYAPTEDGKQHTATYSCCGTTVTEDHSGGEATCQEYAVCEICGTSYGEVDTNNHEYVNGVCACGAIAPIAKNGNGVYEIYVPEHLVEFAQIVNGTHETIQQDKAANAILKDNIDMDGIAWTPICSTGLYYNNSYASGYDGVNTGYAGTFDGDGYAIKNLSVTAIANQTWTYGLFGTMTGTVKNLGIEGFTYNHNGATDMRVGAIVGQNLGGTIENCYVVKATINPGTNVAGGITGCNYAGTIKNCYVANSTVLASASRYGYIAGDNRADTAGDRVGTIENCYTDGDRLVGSYTGTETGCGIRSERRFASGEVAYLLGSAWGQGETLPVLRGGATVYENLCGGDIFYSTTDGDFDSHDFGSDYRCTNCDNYEAPEQDANGVYQIATPSNFFWFAEEVNKGNSTISAVLCNDIDLKGVSWTPIGSEGSPFKGVFDGQNYKIKNLYIHATEGGYYGVFGYLVDGTVKNFSVSGNAVIELSAQEAVYYGVIGAAAARNVNTYVTNVHTTVTLEIKDSFDKNNIAGIVGYAEGKGSEPWYCLYIDRCSFSGSMNFGTAYVDVSGGIAGYVSYNGLVYITNCLYNGTITSECARAQAVGGIVGYNRGLNMYIQNCLSVGTIELKNTGYAGAIAGRYLAIGTSVLTNSKVTNNYYSGSLPAFSNTTDTSINYYNIDIVDYAEYTGKEATSVTDTQLKSGEVTWLLNGSTTENAVWKQTIGLHDVPGFEGATVNLNGTTYENTGNYIYVEISWTAMEFTYQPKTWNPADLKYEGGDWVCAEDGGTVTVENKSSTGNDFVVELTYTTLVEGVTGSFDHNNVNLPSGEKIEIKLSLSGKPTDGVPFTDKDIGTVTVKLKSKEE